ncbi:MAG: TIGR04255 family protein [Planctomycetota bacterium]
MHEPARQTSNFGKYCHPVTPRLDWQTMHEGRQYDNPSVELALVDLRVKPQPSGSSDTPVLPPVWDQFDPPEGYPVHADEGQHELMVESAGPVIQRQATTSRMVARVWTSPDQPQSIRVSQDQLIYTRQRGEGGDRSNWPRWPQRRPEVLEAWRRFRKVVPDRPLTRVGLRYVNQFDLRNENLVLAHYFRTLPDVSTDAAPNGVTQFMLRLELPQPDDQAHCALVMTTAQARPAPSETVSIVLDIDVYKEFTDEQPLADSELESILDELRGLENRIFESTITNDIRRLMSSSAQ